MNTVNQIVQEVPPPICNLQEDQEIIATPIISQAIEGITAGSLSAESIGSAESARRRLSPTNIDISSPLPLEIRKKNLIAQFQNQNESSITFKSLLKHNASRRDVASKFFDILCKYLKTYLKTHQNCLFSYNCFSCDYKMLFLLC